MNSPRKFLFDTTFEKSGKAAAPRREKIAESAKTYTEEELNQVRNDSFAAGKQAGQEAAQESIERQMAQTLASMTQQMAELARAQADAVERAGRAATEAALTVMRKLFPRLAQSHGLTEIEGVIGQCLARLRDEPRVVIRVADSLLDAINGRVKTIAEKAGFEGKIVLLAQEDLQVGDVRVEWADGGASRDSGVVWREIDGIIERVMGGPGTADLLTDSGASSPGTAVVKETLESGRPKAASQ